jgi:AcrR family transcriptional regulator
MTSDETAGQADMADMPVPPWRKPRKQSPPRQPLSQELIVDTAIRVLDAEGLDAVSMRRVAQELNTGPASLYAHVSNKDELRELMIDKITGEIPVPEPDPDRWLEQLKELARTAREVFAKHRDITLVSLASIPTGHNQLKVGEGLLAIMRAGGVPDKIAGWFLDRLGLYLDADAYEGAIFLRRLDEGWDIEGYFGQMHEYYRSLPPDRFPILTSIVDTLMSGDSDERFEFGLDLLTRGLASYAPRPD